MDRVSDLIAQNTRYLDQAAALLLRLDAETLTHRGPGFESGPVGTQLRHVIDAFACFLKGWPGRHVNYDARERDERIESDPAHAARRLAAIRHGLESMSASDGAEPLTVTMDDPRDLPAAAPSSLARELQFLTSHTIHHFAVIALILRAMGVEVDREFGVAPSTLRYWTEAADLAR